MEEHISQTEMYTWNFLEDNVNKIKNLTIVEVARLGHISTATIIRTLKKYGYDGFSDYRISLKNRKKLSRNKGDFSAEAAEAIEKNREEVTRTIKLLNANEIQTIVRIIDKSEDIYVMSAGPTRSVAEYIANKLQLSGKSCISLDDKDYMTFHANKMKETELLLAISLYGETEEIIIASEIAKKRGAKIITLTSNYKSTLANLADYKIFCYKSKLKKFHIGTDTASRIPLEIIARVLLDMYAIHKHLGKIKS